MSDDADFKKGKLHDSIFKKIMEDTAFAASFLKIWLPDYVTAVCDFSTLNPEPGEFTDGHGKTLFCDRLYSVQTRDGSRGWIIAEHQSAYDKNMISRLEEYKRSVTERECKKGELRPLVVPVLVYHGARPYPASQEIYSLYRYPEIERKLNNSFPLADLTAASCNELMTHGQTAILELALKCGRIKETKSAETEIANFLQMATSLKDNCPEEVYTLCMKYWINLNKVSVRNYPGCLEILPRQNQEEIMLMSGGLIQEGRLEGMQKGRQEGIQEGILKGMQKGRLEGIQEGILKGKLETAQKLAQSGMPYAQIAAVTGLTEEDLKKKFN